MATEPTNTALLITTAGGLLALIVQGWLNNRFAASRAREHREQTIADSLLAKEQRDTMAAELALTTQRSAAALLTKIDENTTITSEAKDAANAAYSEANTVNRKIASIGMEMKDGRPL